MLHEIMFHYSFGCGLNYMYVECIMLVAFARKICMIHWLFPVLYIYQDIFARHVVNFGCLPSNQKHLEFLGTPMVKAKFQ